MTSMEEEVTLTQTQQTQEVAFHDDDFGFATPTNDKWARLISENTDAHPHFELTNDMSEILFGRHPDCQIRSTDSRISARHARLYRDKNLVMLQDTSVNGTFVNGERLVKGSTCVLKSGDRISLVLGSTSQLKDDDPVKKGWVSYIIQIIAPKAANKPESLHSLEDAYDVQQELGSGNFSVVKLALKKSTAERFAVKMIDKKKFWQFRNRNGSTLLLSGEVEVLKSVQHPNVVCLRDVFEDEVYLFLVMDLAEGGDLLERILDKGTYSEAGAKRVFKQICDAMKYLHSKGIVHRDLKPENILMVDKTDNSDIKISDFGLAKIIGSGPGGVNNLTTFCGTPQYFAPEVLKSRDSKQGYGKAVDMWSLGVILYILLSGSPPFDDDTLYAQISTGEFDFPPSQWNHISADAKDLVKHLMKVDSEARYTVEQTLAHPWLSGKPAAKPARKKPAVPVMSPTKRQRDVDSAADKREDKKQKVEED
eukprot:GILK01003628.1.p1 GENE.GILK01003628.1~~GILK01003628.1.p1  ORF type:complete len:479 (+),score=104.19 GILK01003628.1:77-1513(+)